jgi:hypothetical protein
VNSPARSCATSFFPSMNFVAGQMSSNSNMSGEGVALPGRTCIVPCSRTKGRIAACVLLPSPQGRG